ncbi:hypothetical protein GUITHDRAFT_135067 [Guillardia theta CCMP2712]|uniref:HMG box domain-containing protein n=2 Tax=Guillardia theta TaxID=55529 RepID=L1JS43_GUITC|nr:hypothetical protein GUITHDRAFT_135067 [Guillardia theta CCMP2712]EKX51010.1 hypothetical protein GUITHDRAFT_135067 [Guillardia theta CCMP2712]|eukprot:XP_005837990.1 hypothetical protein GUITHDRAFT_135067 [Guillardia theta CCMP2712]
MADQDLVSNGQRATPRRQGTGREITTRGFEFKKRVFSMPPQPLADVTSQQNSSIIPSRGRRTGLKIGSSVLKDSFGMERLSDFWNAEEIEAMRRKSSLASDARDRSKTSMDTGPLSEYSGRVSQYSQDTESSNDNDSASPSGISKRSEYLADCSQSSGKASLSRNDESQDQTEQSYADASCTSAEKSNVNTDASKQSISELNSPSVADMSDGSPAMDASKRLSFTDSAEKTSKTDDASPCSSDVSSRQPRVSFAESAIRRKSSISFARTPGTKNGDTSMEDFDVDDCAAADSGDEQNDDQDENQSIQQEEIKPKKAASKKRERDDGRLALIDRLDTMGRASYCNTDSYAPKSKRLSDVAPRPVIEDDGKRRSKRRKMRPLQYWRNERVEYARETGAVLPEIVDLVVRSPEPTPFRRKRSKEEQAVESSPTSANSKAKTVKKNRNKNKKSKKTSSRDNLQKVDVEEDEDEDDAPIKKPKGKTAFFLFSADKMWEVKEQHPDLSISERAQILKDQWLDADEATKKHYERQAKNSAKV